MPLNHFRDLLKGPVNLLTTDDELMSGCAMRITIMRFLAQDHELSYFPGEAMKRGFLRIGPCDYDHGARP